MGKQIRKYRGDEAGVRGFDIGSSADFVGCSPAVCARSGPRHTGVKQGQRHFQPLALQCKPEQFCARLSTGERQSPRQ